MSDQSVRSGPAETYTATMDVSVTDFRASLSDWLDRTRQGEEIVITERGVPVARVVGIGAAPTLERLSAAGVIERPASATRPVAAGRDLPTATRPVSDTVVEQRG